MHRKRFLTGVAALTACLTVAGVAEATGAGAATRPPAESARPVSVVPVAGSAAPFTASARAIGTVPAAQRLSVQVWLRPRTAAAQRFAGAVSTPGSSLFGRFLSPARYTDRFGATRSEAGGVVAWLRTAGFADVHTDAQRNYVRATAATATIEKAFRVDLRLYRSSAAVNAGRYALRGNDRAVSVPAALAASVLGVTGLDNAAPLVPLIRRPGRLIQQPGQAGAIVKAPCSRYYAQHHATGLPEQFGVTSFPTDICGYSAGQLRAAYGASTANDGRGQRIALVELGLTRDMFLTLQDYARANKLPAPSRQRYSQLALGRGSACGDPFDGEEQMDVEASYGMAPAAGQLVVGGDSCNEGDYGMQGLINADIAILDGSGQAPLASWFPTPGRAEANRRPRR